MLHIKNGNNWLYGFQEEVKNVKHFFQNSTKMIMLKSPSDLAVFRGEREIIECNSNDPSAQYIWYVPKLTLLFRKYIRVFRRLAYNVHVFFSLENNLWTICPLYSKIKTMVFAKINILPDN